MADRGNSRGSGTGGKKKDQLSVKVLMPPGRISFPHLFKPQETDNGDRYQLNMLYPPDTDFSKLEKAMDEVMADFFGPKDDWPRGRNDRLPRDVIRPAEEKDYEGYKRGWFFVKASSRDPVGIVDVNREPVENEREVYGGRWARMSVTVRAYDNKSKGVGVYLNSIQVLDHDDQFGGRGPAKNDYDDWDGKPLSDDDRGTGAGHARPRDDDRDDRRGSRDRDNDRGRSRGRDDDDRGRSRGRDDDRERGRDDRGRDRDDDRGSDRRDRSDDRGGRDRDRDDDRRGRDRDTRNGGDRERDDTRSRDTGRSRYDDRADDDDRGGRGGSRGRDDDRRSRDDRDEDDDRGSRRGGRDWN